MDRKYIKIEQNFANIKQSNNSKKIKKIKN